MQLAHFNPAAPAEPALLFPRYMADLIDRAALLLQANFPAAGPLPFNWWADGEEVPYLARVEWPAGVIAGPRVVVLDGRTFELVCKSLAGAPFDIDPSSVCINSRWPDQLDRCVWEQERHARKSARPAKR